MLSTISPPSSTRRDSNPAVGGASCVSSRIGPRIWVTVGLSKNIRLRRDRLSMFGVSLLIRLRRDMHKYTNIHSCWLLNLSLYAR
jgi:hypothetical protein